MTAVVAKNSLQAQSKGAERGECEGAERRSRARGQSKGAERGGGGGGGGGGARARLGGRCGVAAAQVQRGLPSPLAHRQLKRLQRRARPPFLLGLPCRALRP